MSGDIDVQKREEKGKEIKVRVKGAILLCKREKKKERK